MREKILKSAAAQMIGFMTTWATFGGYQPVAVGFFIAVWCSRLIRFPLYPIMVTGLVISSGLLAGAKYALVLFTIMVVFYIMEGKKSRVPIITGAFLGGGVLYMMELTDYYMSSGESSQLIMATATSVLAVSLGIVFYKIIEIFQMPRDRQRGKQEKDAYKEKLNSYEERMNSISDAFAKMARSVEKASAEAGTDEEEIICRDRIDSEPCGEREEYCSRCRALLRQNEIYKNKLIDSRRVIATQLSEMSKILGECLGNTYDLRGITKEEMETLSGKMRESGLVLQKVVRLDNRRGISEIIITMKARKGQLVSIKEMIRIINEVFDKEVEIVKEKKRVIGSDLETYRFREKPNFFVLHGLAKANCEEISGDNFSCLTLDSGQTLLGISDGMGSGVKAYRDSEMVLELIENLMESGFSEETALKLVNTIFVLEGENASPATVDMGIIDMYSGICDFMKLGAASTYVKRGDWVEALRSTSLPMGGNSTPDIESTSKKLYDGDYVIMMSDGIVESAARQNKEEILGKIILEMDAGKPQDMANEILSKALKELGEEKEDDMTVMVAGVWNYAS